MVSIWCFPFHIVQISGFLFLSFLFCLDFGCERPSMTTVAQELENNTGDLGSIISLYIRHDPEYFYHYYYVHVSIYLKNHRVFDTVLLCLKYFNVPKVQRQWYEFHFIPKSIFVFDKAKLEVFVIWKTQMQVLWQNWKREGFENTV